MASDAKRRSATAQGARPERSESRRGTRKDLQRLPTIGPIRARRRRPEYPARERRLGREGRVSLVVEVDAAGAVRDVIVARSAGAAFDASARRAVEDTPFRAARLAERPVASTVTVNVSFELE